MDTQGVVRLVCITGVGAGDSKGHGGFLYDKIVFPCFTKETYVDKDRQEALIGESSLDWIILRPASFTNGPLRGNLRALTDLRRDGMMLEEIGRPAGTEVDGLLSIRRRLTIPGHLLTAPDPAQCARNSAASPCHPSLCIRIGCKAHVMSASAIPRQQMGDPQMKEYLVSIAQKLQCARLSIYNKDSKGRPKGTPAKDVRNEDIHLKFGCCRACDERMLYSSGSGYASGRLRG